MTKIKWENIATIGMSIFFIVANTRAFMNYGFNFNVFMFEFILDVAVLYTLHYLVKNIRKNWN